MEQIMRKTLGRLALFAGITVLTVGVGKSMGSSVVYTSESSFLSAIEPGYYLEDFDTQSLGLHASSQIFSGNGFEYTAAAPSGLYVVNPGGGTNYALSTNTSTDTLEITFTGSTPVTAVGGLFFGTDGPGNFLNSNITITLNDLTTQTFDGITFRGFTSSAAPLLSLSITSDQNPVTSWPTVDHLYVGTSAVPLPAAAGVGFSMLGGFGGLAALRKRIRGKARIA